MLQPAVKKETRNVLVINIIGVAAMFVVFLILHLIIPDKVPFDYTVILGGIGCGAVAFLNFFLMALTVQKVASMEDRDEASKLMKKSYTRRFGLQVIWVIAAIFAPCFQTIAGIIPLLFPGLGIKIYGLFRNDLKNTPAPAAEDAAENAAVSVEEETPAVEDASVSSDSNT